jgi:hypothetical protein
MLKTNFNVHSESLDEATIVYLKGTIVFGISFFYNNIFEMGFISAYVEGEFPVHNDLFYVKKDQTFNKIIINNRSSNINESIFIKRYSEDWKTKIMNLSFLVFTGSKLIKTDTDNLGTIKSINYKFDNYKKQITSEGTSINIIGLDNFSITNLIIRDKDYPLIYIKDKIQKQLFVYKSELESQLNLF